MCGIVGVLSRAGTRPAPDLRGAIQRLDAATTAIEGAVEDAGGRAVGLHEAVSVCEGVAHEFRGFAGLHALWNEADHLEPVVERLGGACRRLAAWLDAGRTPLLTADVEGRYALLTRLRDVHFALEHDRLANLDKVRALAAGVSGADHLRVAYDLNVVLNALDRLEVRGRDSAGIHLLSRGPFESLPADLAGELRRRTGERVFGNRAVREIQGPGGETLFGFVYKVAAEVGELGENVRALRRTISRDELLHHLLETPGVRVDILGHTRWASVGAITERNAHPLNQEEMEGKRDGPYVIGVLNGDVDDHDRIIREEGLDLPEGITTDAKVIPLLVSRALPSSPTAQEAFRRVVGRLAGSVAIACETAEEPGRFLLALRGSGQALYVGLADDAWVVASEPYGIVEEAECFLRLDGEHPAHPDRPSTRGQIVVLDAARAGEAEGIERIAYDGTRLPVSSADFKRLEITSRDVDRGEWCHFLRKEIEEAPESIQKTLRGRLVTVDGALGVHLGEEILPASVREDLARGRIRWIRVIGQGTAAVAGLGVAGLLARALRGASIAVEALPATETSGFHLRDDMSDELVVAISQSGTTTDTNRTVDLLRARGAKVIGIVNRRQSDLTERVDGVLYTSDGRDVEMSVASTKAFYSQIAAGALLAEALAEAVGVADAVRRERVLRALRDLPRAMRVVLAREDQIERAAKTYAPNRRHWAVVGNGADRVAAHEIRIKLSELCYKSIACDVTEDKKHIDLSSEPLILVCASGVSGANAVDVGKEVEIFAAHKACPIVIATEGNGVWNAAAAVLEVPRVAPELAFVLATMVGHLFGYHGALAIDALAQPLRDARAILETIGETEVGADVRDDLRAALVDPFRQFTADLAGGRYDGTLDARPADRLSLAFRYAMGVLPLDGFPEDFGSPGTPDAAVAALSGALTEGIDALTRPIDAIKHQAKTVTVGVSRGEDVLLAVPLVRTVCRAGASAERLAYEDLRILHALDPAVAEVLGHTRYALEAAGDDLAVRIVGRGGISVGLASRTEEDDRLSGTKHTVALERRVLVAVGRSDHRPIVLVPEVAEGRCTGIVLLHVRLLEELDAATIRSVLGGYRNRYVLIRDAVMETGAVLRDEDLERIGILDLLTRPVLDVADQLTGAFESRA